LNLPFFFASPLQHLQFTCAFHGLDLQCFLKREVSTEGFGLWLRPASVDALTGLLFLFLHRFRLARFSRSRFVPPRQHGGAGLFAGAGFGFARSGLSADSSNVGKITANLTVYFHRHKYTQAACVLQEKSGIIFIRRLPQKKSLNPAATMRLCGGGCPIQTDGRWANTVGGF